MKRTMMYLFPVLCVVCSGASAHCVKSKFYGGGGVTFNEMQTYDESTGYQFFAGYCLNIFKPPQFKSSLEFGYLDSGSFERERVRFANNPNRPTEITREQEKVNGFWTTMLAEYKVDPRFHLMGRLGLDLGDDSGAMAGIGFAFNIRALSQIRMEYVSRDETDSVQVNFITEF